jgi:hypothetical protein
MYIYVHMFIKVLIALICCHTKRFRVSNRVSYIRGFGHEFLPESVFGSVSGFKFGFRFWVPRYSTRSEPDPLPSLLTPGRSGSVLLNQTHVICKARFMVCRSTMPSPPKRSGRHATGHATRQCPHDTTSDPFQRKSLRSLSIVLIAQGDTCRATAGNRVDHQSHQRYLDEH